MQSSWISTLTQSILAKWRIHCIQTVPRHAAESYIRQLDRMWVGHTVPRIYWLLDSDSVREAHAVRLLWTLGELCSQRYHYANTVCGELCYDDVLELVAKKMRDPSVGIRQAATLALARFNDHTVPRLLLAALTPEDPENRPDVEDALVDYVARFGDSDGAVTKAAIEPGNDRLRKHLVELMEALLTGRQPRTEFIRRGIKAGVFVNFDCFGDRITRNKLESTGLSGLEILATEQELVRIVEENSGPQALLKRLVDLGGPQAKAALAKRLSTPDKAVEQRAALHAEIVCLVEDLLASRHDDLRAPALEALRRYLKFADVLSWEGFDGDFRVEAGRMVGFYCRAVHLLGRHGARCDADLLIARLGEAGESVRAAIGKALRNLGEPGLGAAVLGDDGDFGRLCQHRDPRLIRPFAHRISGPYSRDDYTVEKWLRTESEHANAADQQIISQALVKMKEWREHFRGSGEW